MILIYSYCQLNVQQQTVKLLSFPQPKSLEQAALFCMKLNEEGKIYGAVYYLIPQNQYKKTTEKYEER